MRATTIEPDGGAGRPLVLTGGAVLADPPDPPRDAVVVIADGRIRAVGPRGAVAHPPGAEVRDLGGAFLAPGLVDAHLHAGREALAALRAAGVTTAFDPAGGAGDPPRDPAWPGTGPPLDGPGSPLPRAVVVPDAGAARAAVRSLARAGYRAVKLHARLDPDLVRAAAAEARDLGLRVIGDLGRTAWVEAARAGVHVICHAAPQHPGLLPAARRGGYLERLRAGLAHPLVDWYAALDLQGPEVAETVAALRAADASVCPTLVTLEAYVFEDPDPALSRVMPGWPRVPPPRRAETWARVLAFVGHLHAQGVRLLAGTDAPRPGVASGASLHRELELLVAAGLRPVEALAAATAWAADGLGLGDRGRIAVGLRADLVVLEGPARISGGASGPPRPR